MLFPQILQYPAHSSGVLSIVIIHLPASRSHAGAWERGGRTERLLSGVINLVASDGLPGFRAFPNCTMPLSL